MAVMQVPILYSRCPFSLTQYVLRRSPENGGIHRTILRRLPARFGNVTSCVYLPPLGLQFSGTRVANRDHAHGCAFFTDPSGSRRLRAAGPHAREQGPTGRPRATAVTLGEARFSPAMGFLRL